MSELPDWRNAVTYCITRTLLASFGSSRLSRADSDRDKIAPLIGGSLRQDTFWEHTWTVSRSTSLQENSSSSVKHNSGKHLSLKIAVRFQQDKFTRHTL
jgi:hypothetical protein